MVIVKYLCGGNSYNNLMSTLFVSILWLVSIECISDEFSSNVKKNTSNDTLSSVNRIRTKQTPYDYAADRGSPITYHVACVAGKECKLTCPYPVPTPKDGSNITVQWACTSKECIGEKYYHYEWNLTLQNLTAGGVRKYSCSFIVQRNPPSENYRRLELHVYEDQKSIPIIIKKPHNEYVPEGHNAFFECQILNAATSNVTWLHNGETIKNNNHFGIFVGSLGITRVTKNLFGNYTCLVHSPYGTESSSAFLSGKKPDGEATNAPSTARDNNNNSGKSMYLFFIATFFVVGAVIVVLRLYRVKNGERRNGGASRMLLTLRTKKIIVEKPASACNNQVPTVRIERRQATSVRSDSSDAPEYELLVDTVWEIPRDRLTLGRTLGQGNFGRVVMAEAHSIVEENVTTTVAVKMLKDRHSDSDMLDLVEEMEILKMIGNHDNVINLLGCCTQGGPLLIITPYAPYGNLRDFLRQRKRASGYEIPIGQNPNDDKSLCENNLVSFAYQIAKGMEYLASKKLIHRDLAARNILVSEHYAMKIADFGLARRLHSDDYYRKKTGGRLPVKWMAPEALFHRKYTTESDVWSYGILLWEIMTFGGTPYPSFENVELHDLLRSGLRMAKPACCSKEVYSIMIACWSYEPNRRPMFSDLVTDLDHILTKATSYGNCVENLIYEMDTSLSKLESSDSEDQTHDYLL